MSTMASQPHPPIKIKVPRHWHLCGEFVTGEFPAQRVSNVENVSIWWRTSSWYKLFSCLHKLFTHWQDGVMLTHMSLLLVWLVFTWHNLKSVVGFITRTPDSFTVPLHNPNGRHLPAIRAVQGDCQWHLKMAEIPTGHEATIHCDWGNLNLYLDQIITKRWCHPIRH